jgi:hypothetical protein
MCEQSEKLSVWGYTPLRAECLLHGLGVAKDQKAAASLVKPSLEVIISAIQKEEPKMWIQEWRVYEWKDKNNRWWPEAGLYFIVASYCSEHGVAPFTKDVDLAYKYMEYARGISRAANLENDEIRRHMEQIMDKELPRLKEASSCCVM